MIFVTLLMSQGRSSRQILFIYPAGREPHRRFVTGNVIVMSLN
jgi:hypothetical protein